MTDAPGFSELSNYDIDPGVAPLLEVEYCLEKLVVILGNLPADRAAPLTVGMVDPEDAALIAELTDRLGRPVEAVQLNRFEVRRCLGMVHGVAIPGLAGSGLADLNLSSAREIDFSPDLTASRLVDDMLSVAVRRHASDIHLETYRADVDLRFRIDTELVQVTTPLSPENIQQVVSRLKVLAELDPLERREAQDGHFCGLYHDGPSQREIDFRISVVPGKYGEDAVLRVLDPTRFRVDLGRLGIDEPSLARYRQLAAYPDGLILVTGPTLSGKTNTLYATLRDLQQRGLKIVTVEDPVEFEFPKINQKNVTDTMSFSDYVRAFLRQNPDVIVVGEIRDEETADVVVRAATTGHMVLSSVHTRDALGAVARMRALDVPDDTLATILVGLVGQRLVRVVCPSCREETTPPPELVRLYFSEAPEHPFVRGRGCDACGGTGCSGLTALFELLEVTAPVEAAIAGGAPMEELRQVALDGGFRPLAEDALAKLAAGTVSLEEVSRRINPIYR